MGTTKIVTIGFIKEIPEEIMLIFRKEYTKSLLILRIPNKDPYY